MRSRRAVGSLIGIGFLLMILSVGFSYYNIINRVEETSTDRIEVMMEIDRDAADEELEIQNVALTVGNSLNLTIKNTGNEFSELEWIGVFDDTLNTQSYYRVDTSLNPVETQKNIGNATIVMNPVNIYTIQVLTKLGNIYYGEYPQPTGGGGGGGGGFTGSQYYYVNTTGDTYAPDEFGFHSLFGAMQDGPDHINDTLTEQQSVFLGNIGDAIIDTLEFETGTGNNPSVVPVSGDIYAIAYAGPGTDGWLATVEIAPDGTITNTVVDTYEFQTSLGDTPDIVHVSGNIYAIAYRGAGSDGFIRTVEILTDGTITPAIIDTLEYDTGAGINPSFIHIAGDIFAVAYTGPGSDGWLTTVEIATNGQITDTVVDTLEFDPVQGLTPYISHISGDYYSIVYIGSGADGFLITVEIATTGQITNTVVDSWEFEPNQCDNPQIVPVSGDIYAIVFRGVNNDGDIATVDISTTGVITPVFIDLLQFDVGNGNTPTILNVQGDYFVIAYSGGGTDGFVVTVEIDTSGVIADTVIDTLEFDPSRGVDPFLFPITSEVHAVAFSGDGSDGFVTTFQYDGGAYTLDLEVNWFDLPTRTNEYLTIYGGVMGAENLQVDYWNGASWVNIIPRVTYEWNVIDVSPYLTGPTFTIRFVDSVQVGDTVEDSWEIDVVYLHLFD